MKLLWNEVKRIEALLKSKKDTGFAQLWLSKSQKHKRAVEEQQAVYPYITWLGRRSLKKEIQAIEKKYFQSL